MHRISGPDPQSDQMLSCIPGRPVDLLPHVPEREVLKVACQLLVQLLIRRDHGRENTIHASKIDNRPSLRTKRSWFESRPLDS